MNRYDLTSIQFYLNGKPVKAEIPPAMSTLDYVTKVLGFYGTKCSCNEGDCGACTVVIASVKEGNVVYEAINSCLYPAGRLHGKHLITVEGLGSPDKLHPIQQAMLDFHATQCGYCTPGFVMSAFALFAMQARPSREDLMAAFEGNLCRCTGYDSIYRAMQDLAEKMSPEDIVPRWARDVEPWLFGFSAPVAYPQRESASIYSARSYFVPKSLVELDEFLSEHPQASFISGGTDVMVGINIQHRKHETLIDLTAIPELRKLYLRQDGLHIGAGCTYSEILDSGIIRTDQPAFTDLIRVIASKQIRNFGTIGGNIANASPVGDSLPILLVLDATLRLYHNGEKRDVRMSEFFTGYKQTLLQAGEIILEVIIPVPEPGEIIHTTKAAKRNAVDISAISSAVRLVIAPDKTIKLARLAFGGSAAIPKLSERFSSIVGKELSEIDPLALAQEVAAEFSPISDVRGSAEYRATLIRNHVFSYLNELSEGGSR